MDKISTTRLHTPSATYQVMISALIDKTSQGSLVNSSFLPPDSYRKSLTQLVAEEESLDVAVAFWGRGAKKLIHPVATKPIRIICNLKTGGTNPFVIESFLKLSREKGVDVQIRQCDRLHAKVILGKTQAVIGSANISANGLGLEDEDFSHWLEAGVHVRQSSELDEMQTWFDALWSSVQVRVIEDCDIEAAHIAWKRNRPAPTPTTTSNPDFFSLSDFSISSLRRANVYALLYRRKVSPAAQAKLSAIQTESVDPNHSVKTGIRLWGYENWPDFPSDIRAEYLDIRWGLRNGVRVFGPCRLLGRRATVQYDDGSFGTLDIANPVDTLLDLPFEKHAREQMETALKSCIEAVWQAAEGDECVRVVHLADIATMIQEAEQASSLGRRISGIEAINVLASMSSQVVLREPDNTNKFWCYKLQTRKGTEFAFDPRTSGGLYVRLDRQPPDLPGLVDAKKIVGTNMSTALDRVFSGGVHKAAYKVTIQSESALRAFVDHLMTL